MRASVVVLGIGVFWLLLWPLHWPPQVDAAHYVYAAHTLIAGRGLLLDPAWSEADSPYLTQWPPLTSLTYAALLSLGLPMPAAARAFNALAYGAVLALVWRLLPRFKTAGILALLTPFFLEHFRYANSEAGFILLTVVFFALLFREPLPLLALSIVAALACLQRYSGVVIVATGAVYILSRWGWRPALAFILLPAVSLGGWLLRNVARIGSAFGDRFSPRADWLTNTTDAGRYLLAWVLIAVLFMGVQWLINGGRLRSLFSPTRRF